MAGQLSYEYIAIPNLILCSVLINTS